MGFFKVFSHILLFKYQIQLTRLLFHYFFFSQKELETIFPIRRFFLKIFFLLLCKNRFVWPGEPIYFKEENEHIELSIPVLCQF